MIEVLKDQFYQDVLPEYLPDDVVSANKTGFITGVRHDSGIFYLPDGQSYVLIFLSKDLPDEDRGRDVGREISLKIHDWLSGKIQWLDIRVTFPFLIAELGKLLNYQNQIM